MTDTLAPVRFARLGIAASLLAAALLIGSAHAGSAAVTTPVTISAPAPQGCADGQPGPDIGQGATQPEAPLPAFGAVGMGWG